MAQGWNPKEKQAFTPMPWSIQVHGKQCTPYPIFEEKPDLLKEVLLEHPENPAFKRLGKWYGIPILSIWHWLSVALYIPVPPSTVGTWALKLVHENLADETRYNILPKIAELFKLETKTNRSLWRDRALIELNRAVLHSFDCAGIRIGDHHSLTRQFEKFCEAEAKAQCPITGDWSWLVPPISASQTPTFSQEFDPEVVQHTNFFIKQPHQKKLNQGHSMMLTARENEASALSLPPKLKLKIQTQFNRLLNGVPQDCNTPQITQIHLVRKNFWIENSNKNWLLHHEGRLLDNTTSL